MNKIELAICVVAFASMGVAAAILGELSGIEWIPVQVLGLPEQRAALANFGAFGFLVPLIVVVVVVVSVKRRAAQ